MISFPMDFDWWIGLELVVVTNWKIWKMSIVFDFDSTLVCDESLVCLIKSSCDDVEIHEKVEEITRLGISGKIDMISSWQKRLELARPTISSVNNYLTTIDSKITKGVKEIIVKLIEMKIPIYIVSQGPKCLIEPVADILKIPRNHIHAVNVDFERGERDGRYISETEEVLLLGKSNIVKKMIERGEISTSIIVVGDGASDMRIKTDGVAQVGICFGLHLQIEQAISISDFYVTTISQFETVLFDQIHKMCN